jgi:hypothetical protein
MYLISRRKWMGAVLVVLFAVFFYPIESFAHGGGHGGGNGHSGGGGHGGSGSGTHYGGGTHLSSGRSGSSGFAYPLSGPAEIQNHLTVNSPGFPEDLPEARIHRFLQQHLLHPHLPTWIHG